MRIQPKKESKSGTGAAGEGYYTQGAATGLLSYSDDEEEEEKGSSLMMQQ